MAQIVLFELNIELKSLDADETWMVVDGYTLVN